MDIFWKTMARVLDYKLNDKSRINIKTSHIQGDRSSLGFLLPITVKDSINGATGQYNARILDIDQYNNFSTEARFLFNYGSNQNKHALSGGIRYYYGSTQRYKDGKGTNGIDYNTSLALTARPKNIQYQATNVAFFMENMFQFKRLVIIPGIRFEKVNGKASGINGIDIAGLPIKLQEQQRSRAFLLMGLGAEYQINNLIECYGNFTQAW
jgi:Fe(3+) dicitrate transport protein